MKRMVQKEQVVSKTVVAWLEMVETLGEIHKSWKLMLLVVKVYCKN